MKKNVGLGDKNFCFCWLVFSLHREQLQARQPTPLCVLLYPSQSYLCILFETPVFLLPSLASLRSTCLRDSGNFHLGYNYVTRCFSSLAALAGMENTSIRQNAELRLPNRQKMCYRACWIGSIIVLFDSVGLNNASSSSTDPTAWRENYRVASCNENLYY